MVRAEQTTIQTIRQLSVATWRATKGDRPRFFLFLICFMLAYAVDLASPWAIGSLLGVFVKQGFTDAAFQEGIFLDIRLRRHQTF